MYAPSPVLVPAPAGIRLATYQWGGEGPPILLAHPTGFHGRIWAPVVPRLLDAGHAVYSFDFRGQGDSDPSPDTYSWANFANDVTAVADHFGLSGRDDLIAAGHSKGAAAILLAEVQRPQTFGNIWAFEPITFPQTNSPAAPATDPLSSGALKRRNAWASIDEAFAAYSAKPPLNTMSPESLHAYVDYGFKRSADGHFELKCAPENEAAMYRNGPTNGVFERLHEISSKVVVHVGSNTMSIPPKLGAMIVEQLQNATLQIWEGHGHFGPQEDPTKAAQTILACTR